ILFVAIAIGANIRTIYLLCKYLAGREYEFLNRAQILDNRHKQLINHYNQQQLINPYNQSNSQAQADAHFKEDVINYYINAANHNFNVNDGRIKQMGKAHECIILSVVVTLLAIACYIPTFIKKDANVQKVEIYKPAEDNLKQVNKKPKDNIKTSKEESAKEKVESSKKVNDVEKENHNDK
ncbi:hypothetical protein ABEY96_28165, partial [Priestia aryabhattai]|uniref:hypothetical protein n=1 Tax=Priestia aryabhattai TaxID=412384 RepID=UPI003D2D729B